ncbi:MAG: glycoside hydrolase family 75 protein [Verrucomicrobia bacterium]|nr:glycoside hydrolase family 75 protein [Verrucomicrobiota bacterium]
MRKWPNRAPGITQWLAALLWLEAGLGCVQKKPATPGQPAPEVSPAQTAAPAMTPLPSAVLSLTPGATPAPSPETFISRSSYEVSRLFNGFEIHSRLSTTEGQIAALEKKDPGSYVLNLDVQVRVPKPAQTLEELQTPDPQLSSTLPGLPELLSQARVSSCYYGLYRLKTENLNRALGRLDLMVSRQNFFDCNTMLEMTGGASGRKALLIQAPMDVNADGSDADRTYAVDGSSANFQPFTSYRWPKRTDRPSQFLDDRENRLKTLQVEFDAKSTPPDRKKVVREQIDEVQRQIADLKRFSYLVAMNDPYIVLPGFMLRPPVLPFTPRFGDYVVVIFRGKLYPALLGDAGPSYKMGEGSLRLATTLNVKANALNRPVSDVAVAYVVFPGSAEPQPGPPDLAQLRSRCESLLGEIGGYRGELWTWPDLLAPTPSPSPSPSPSPTAVPGTAPSPTAPSGAETITPGPTATPSPG